MAFYCINKRGENSINTEADLIMSIPFKFYKCVLPWVAKSMKFVGQYFVPIVLLTSTGVIAIVGKLTLDKIEKENTKYEYNGWLLYKQGDYIYAKKEKQLIKVETTNFNELEKMIESNS